MCGRYYIDPALDDPELARLLYLLGCNKREDSNACVVKTGEIFPSDVVPAVTAQSVVPMKWGFDFADKKTRVINARVETLAQKPMFRQSFKTHRCLLPASCYFEWKQVDAKKQKVAIGTNKTIFMAGLYRLQADGMPVFVIVTRPAVEDIAFVHARMPLILPADCQKAWVDASMDTVQAMYCQPDPLTACPV